MKKHLLFATALLSAALAVPAAAQVGEGRLSVEPYVGYGFFGSLPGTDASLEADLALGARAGYQLSPQFAVFGNYQRSTPTVTGTLPLGFQQNQGQMDVDHWSAGVEFSYIPRGGAEGMLPILLEAGLGQVRYEGGENDLAANLGIASALQLSRNFAIRYGANDYISNFRDEGITNQVFVRVGGELRF
jgi:hypothetical protein